MDELDDFDAKLAAAIAECDALPSAPFPAFPFGEPIGVRDLIRVVVIADAILRGMPLKGLPSNMEVAESLSRAFIGLHRLEWKKPGVTLADLLEALK